MRLRLYACALPVEGECAADVCLEEAHVTKSDRLQSADEAAWLVRQPCLKEKVPGGDVLSGACDCERSQSTIRSGEARGDARPYSSSAAGPVDRA